MDEKKRKLVGSWLDKAENDLISARRLASGPDPILDTAIYHCQQVAEKALKAFLVYHDVPFEKIHNLSILIDLCAKVTAEFRDYEDAASTLTPYATAFRYPSELFESVPDQEQIEEAIELASKILGFVVQILPHELYSPKVNEQVLPKHDGDKST